MWDSGLYNRNAVLSRERVEKTRISGSNNIAVSIYGRLTQKGDLI